jgi:hypothetical protein
MSTPEESINTNFCLQWSKKAPTLYKDQTFFFKNWSSNKKKMVYDKMSCMHVRAAQESSCDTETYNKYMAKEQQN